MNQKYRALATRASALALTSALAAAAAVPAYAQDASVGADNTPVVPEVVVTAQKRSERLQDVPISVDVVGAADLQKNGVRDFKDVMRNVPGVSFSGADLGQSRYSIRGISTNSPSPTVGVYLDDLSLLTTSTNFAGAVDPVFFDVERVEVLKGPQGTLYGGSAMGGAIKYVSQMPNLRTRSLDVGAGGSYTAHGAGSYDGQATINLPIVDDVLALRAGVMYRHDGGYIDNVANAPHANFSQSITNPPTAFVPATQPSLSTNEDKDYNSDHVFAVKAALRWEPDASWQITPSILYQDYHQANPGILWTNLPDLQSSFRLDQPTTDRLTVGRIAIVKHFDNFDVTSLSGYVKRHLDQDRDYSFYVGGLVPPLYALNSPENTLSSSRTYSQEFRIASNDSLAKLRWTAGLFYSDQDESLDQTVQTIGAGAALGTGTDTVYFGQTGFKTKQFAFFGDATYQLLPKVDVNVGIRVFRIRQQESLVAGGLFAGGNSASNGKNTQSGVDPRVEVDYKPTPDHMVYASAAKGFRPGGVNSTFSAALCQADLANLGLTQGPSGFNSDKLWTYEAGSKNEFFAGRATLNGAVYYTDWKNIQQTILLPSCGFSFTGNVGAAEIKGAELSGKFAVTHGLTVGGAASYSDATITQTAPGVSAQAGQPVLDTPKWIASAFADYVFDVGPDTMSLRAEYQFHGSQLRDFAASYTAHAANGSPMVVPNFSQRLKAYQVVNLNATWEHDGWQLQAYIQNLFDRAPIIDYNRTEPIGEAFTLRPRTIGVGVRKHFE